MLRFFNIVALLIQTGKNLDQGWDEIALRVDKWLPRRVKSWLFSPNHSHAFLRGIAMSTTIVAYTVMVTSVMIIKDYIRKGQLPWYFEDALIVGVAVTVTALAPVIGWLGWWRRRTTMMLWMGLPLIVFGFLGIPYSPAAPSTEFCNPAKPLDQPEASSSMTGYAVLLVVICVTMALTLTATLTHTIGFMADHNLEGMFSSFGILVMVAVLGFEVISKLFADGILPELVVGLTAVMVVLHLLQLLNVPETAPPVAGGVAPSNEGRGIRASLWRVVTNKVGMQLTLAMALNAAGLWGFAYNEVDMVKVKYLETYRTGFIESNAEILRYLVVLLVVVVIAAKYSAPLMPVFSQKRVLKMAYAVAVMSVLVYAAATGLHCKLGSIAGLGTTGSNYTQPACSLECRCDPTQITYAPLCVVEQMTTYLSPCHAGCVKTDDAKGIEYFSGCACASGHGRALPGGCSTTGCHDAFDYHKLLMFTLILLSVVYLQLLGVLVLRAVDARDRSVAVGVMLSVVTFVVFVAGHGVFFAIRVNTCAWFEGGACQFHAPLFAQLAGGASAAFALAATLITGE